MLRIVDEWKRQGQLHLRIAQGQSWGQTVSSDTYIYGNPVPAVRLDGFALLINCMQMDISTDMNCTYT